MAEENSSSSKPGTESTEHSLTLKNDQSEDDSPGIVTENNHLDAFETALLKVQEQNYDKTLISELIETHTQLLSDGQTAISNFLC